MTSGQNGPYGDPGQQGQQPSGPPQDWNAPPAQPPYGQQPPQGQPPQGQPPYGQPPYGQPPPQGQPPYGQPPYGQQYPGYAPAPSAPTGHGAPTPMERPTTVRAGIGAFVAGLVLAVVSSIVTFADFDDLIDQALRESTDPALTEDLARTGVLIGVVITLIIIGLEALFIWFAWQGRNWARIVLFVLGGLGVVFGFFGLAAGTGATTGFLTSLGWFQLLLSAVGIVLLALKPSNDWYRYRGWQRANGQG
ncbi:MAG TPA: hypothetical protein VFG13_00795 [Blastococcus sp.]|nr:hypothetical protein [Blastococcus sp.]